MPPTARDVGATSSSAVTASPARDGLRQREPPVKKPCRDGPKREFLEPLMIFFNAGSRK